LYRIQLPSLRGKFRGVRKLHCPAQTHDARHDSELARHYQQHHKERDAEGLFAHRGAEQQQAKQQQPNGQLRQTPVLEKRAIDLPYLVS